MNEIKPGENQVFRRLLPNLAADDAHFNRDRGISPFYLVFKFSSDLLYRDRDNMFTSIKRTGADKNNGPYLNKYGNK